VVAAAPEWRLESDRWLELPESALGTSTQWSSGVVVAVVVAGVPHPAGLAAPVKGKCALGPFLSILVI
jgi:hypothetical protein